MSQRADFIPYIGYTTLYKEAVDLVNSLELSEIKVDRLRAIGKVIAEAKVTDAHKKLYYLLLYQGSTSCDKARKTVCDELMQQFSQDWPAIRYSLLLLQPPLKEVTNEFGKLKMSD